MNTVRQIIQNCIIDPIDLDVNDLPSFDLEYFFLQLRARSVNEKVVAKYRCNNEIETKTQSQDNPDDLVVETKECGNEVPVTYNLLEVPVVRHEGHSPKIQLTPTVGVVMKYPTIRSTESIVTGNPTDQAIDTIISCMDIIWEGESVYKVKDQPKEDLIQFLEDMSNINFQKIDNFFKTMPTLKQSVDVKCSKCGYDHHIDMEGLTSFFV